MFLLKSIIALTLFATITAALLAKGNHTCPANEHFNATPRCSEFSCDRISKNRVAADDSCLDPPAHGPARCYCNHNFARNKNGVCVPPDQCHEMQTRMIAGQRCPANEVYAEDPLCPDTACDMFCKVPPRFGDSPCIHGNISLPSKCYCVSDYARNKAGICIPVEQCKCTLAGTRSCPANEVYVENPTCLEWTCKMSNNVHPRSGNPPPCVHGNVTGPSGCFCVPNFARNKAGICIPFEQCKHQ